MDKKFSDSKRMIAAIVTTAASSIGMCGGLYVGMNGHPPVITPDVFGWWMILLGSVWGTAIGTTGVQNVYEAKNGHAAPAPAILGKPGAGETSIITNQPVASKESEVVEPDK